MRHVSLAVLGCALLAGCSGLQRPTSQVGSAAITDASEQGARVVIPVVLRNPNDTPLPIRETRYTIGIAGHEPFEFTDKTVATMPAQGVQTLRLPAAFATFGDGAEALAGRSYTIRGSVVYQPPGEIRQLLTDSGFPLPSVGFSGSGELQSPAPSADQ